MRLLVVGGWKVSTMGKIAAHECLYRLRRGLEITSLVTTDCPGIADVARTWASMNLVPLIVLPVPHDAAGARAAGLWREWLFTHAFPDIAVVFPGRFGDKTAEACANESVPTAKVSAPGSAYAEISALLEKVSVFY